MAQSQFGSLVDSEALFSLFPYVPPHMDLRLALTAPPYGWIRYSHHILPAHMP